MQPKTIKANIHLDQRGKVTFANDFDLQNIRRFYMIEQPDTKIIRAWQGHKKESKYFFPIKGKFVVAWVKIDDFDKPAANLPAEYKILNADKPQVLYLPAGYANGFRALQNNAMLAVFSDASLEKSENDDYRYPPEKWFDWFREFEG